MTGSGGGLWGRSLINTLLVEWNTTVWHCGGGGGGGSGGGTCVGGGGGGTLVCGGRGVCGEGVEEEC